ncbi:Gypsy retrotransposon integrase-like protein 1 [Frankliniella fusca]|uniref:Gypsy retrotransposon integrase-like protein 1 n=1 Tax=Frankliniella fusca TaxID=407009 RepID=A0AAE1LRH5_9NEOP|nr:Gypsy retrotransposon integrase-like protein 1 [Frankliniella fusca]
MLHVSLCFGTISKNPKDYPLFKVEGVQLYKLISVGRDVPHAWVRLLPQPLILSALKEVHDSPIGGHFGVLKTWNRMRQFYYFPKMKQVIRDYIKKCSSCFGHKPVLLKPSGFMGAQRVCSQPWEVISADLMGYFPTTTSGNRFLLVITDLFSKYVEIFAIKKAEAKAALNTAVHDVTGFSPHRLVFGTELCLDGRLRELRAPSDPELPDCADRAVHLEKLASLKEMYLTVLSRLQKAYEKNARSYNLRRREVRYEEGQVVYRRNYVKSDAAAYFSTKLAPKYLGPFVIKKRVGARGYLLVGQDGKEDGPWHVHDLKLSPESTEMCT